MSVINVPIRGMHCASCEILIKEKINKLSGITNVKVSHKRGEAEVYYCGNEPSAEDIRKAVQAAGYDVGSKEKLPWLSRNTADYYDLIKAAFFLFVVYKIAGWFGLLSISSNAQNTGVMVALVVGLVAGVSTCMALVGGLVLSFSARHAELHPEATTIQKFRPHIYFNLGRILGYAFLGGIIGFLGSSFKPSPNILGLLTMVIGAVMLFFGLKLIEIFPILRDKSITLPSSIAKLFGFGKEIREYSHKSAMVTGALTFFLPCGFTQAMQLYAVSTGSLWQGMMIMGLFAIGTAPGLLGIGGLSSVFSGRKARLFFMTAGLAVIILGWYNITNGNRLFNGVSITTSGGSTSSNLTPLEVRMAQNSNGYSPNVLTIEKDRPVKWIINSTAPYSCASSIVVPSYGISESLHSGENIITFTPTQVGEISFSCSMGMYRGKFIVVDRSGSSKQLDKSQPGFGSVASGSSCGAGGGGGCGGCGGAARQVQPQVGSVSSIPSDSASSAGSNDVQLLETSYTYNNDIQPNTFTVKKDKPVRFVVDVKENGAGCMSAIMVQSLYERPEVLRAGNKVEMDFTPTTIGSYQITCAMGVPRGVINVVN